MLKYFVKMQKSMNRPIIEKKYITKKAKLIEPQIKKLVNWTISRKKSPLCSVPVIEGASCLVLYSLGL